MRRLIPLLLLAAPAAHAWGPAVHVMEADVALERLLAGHPEWAALVDAHPLAQSYLRLGALSPDFQWLTDALPFGHGKGLSYHLLDAAPADRPELKLFALGHLAHNTSDAVSETFFGPHAWASQPIGYHDLLAGVHDDGQGEVELVCEALGDLTLASWEPVVDLLFDFYLEDEAAQARGAEAVRWYCETGVAYTGEPLNCEDVTAAVLGRLATAEELVAGLNRAGAKRVVNALLDQPLERLVTVALDGPLAGVLGERAGAASPTYEWELKAITEGPVLTDAFWAPYAEHFADLSAVWVEARLADRIEGFPGWDPNALIAANWLSSLRFDPERFAPHQGLIPDAVRWRVDGDAGEVDVRLFAAVPYAGEVRAVVRLDNATDLDGLGPAVAEARAPLAVDPRDYGPVEPLTMTVPFVADWALWPTALGLTVSLHHGDDPLPFFTTDADAIWSSPAPGKHRASLRHVFRTYGNPFPASLARPEPPGTGRLHVVSKLQGLDFPVGGLTAQVPEQTQA
ncbi:MAG: hypothetical protein KC613_22225, partial [Myxococcales bacterium]|nr:hypothetical protein [Myxococcales bacterium]